MKTAPTALALIVSLLIVGNISAAEEKKAAEAKPAVRVPDPMADMMKGLNLTDDQKAKIEKLDKEFAAKFGEVSAKMESILTAEQKKARDEVLKAGLAAGKNQAELANAMGAAMKLSDVQLRKMDEAAKELAGLQQQHHVRTMALLTREQKNQLMRKMFDESKPRQVD